MPNKKKAAEAADVLPSFNVSKADAALIARIADRAFGLLKEFRVRDITAVDISMDITACHANGNPLRLSDLLDADDFNFTHDVFGINRHLDRETGVVSRFRPRFSVPAKS